MKKIFNWVLAAIIVCGLTVLTACSNDDNPAGQQGEYTGMPLVIYDTDIGSSADDLFAMEMLYHYEDEGRCRLLGVMVDREGERNAAFADVMNTYFGHGITFAKTFFQNWPQEVDMVFSPMETGQDVEYTPEQVIADVSWTDVHPIKQVYMQCDCNTGQRMWDVMPVIQAVEGDALFTLSQRGTVRITDQAETVFTPSATGNCRYQLPGTEAWAAQMLEKIRNAIK